MGGIRFDGLATGLQTSALIEALISFERRPLDQIQSRQRQIESRQDLFRTLNTNLVALASAAAELDNQNSLLTGPTLNEELFEYVANSSDEAFVTATANGSASPGPIDIRVDALAQLGRQFSDGFASATAIVVQAGETISIDFGGAAPIDITIGAGGASLQDLRSLVNSDVNNGGAVRADVLFDGTVHRLVLSGTQTGAANDLSITTNFSGPGGAGPFFDAALTQVASDAQIQALGINITRSSNVIDNLFNGVTLELHAAHDPAVPTDRTTIDVVRDDEAITEKLQTFVDAYNAVRQISIDHSGYNAETGTPGLLSGDSTLRSIDRKIQEIVGDMYTFAGNPFSSMSQLGVSFDEDGLLTLDAKKLEAAFDQDAAAVRQILAGDGTTDGVAVALGRELVNMTDSDPLKGTLAIRDEGFDMQIRALDQTIERFEARLAQREEMLVQRFSRLESLISGLQAQGNYVASAFTNNGN